ncbi:MAG TPA: hypothetical protein VH298_16805, partial [Jatrophihabitans sp.]|nr:hypothetical protein [Jatrophihabitans sp.]
MATRSARTPQQRDAHELARTPQADPYRGSMLDPFAASSPVAKSPTTKPAASPPTKPPANPRPTENSQPVRSQPVAPWASTATPAAATIAGVLGLMLSLPMALFGISLLALLSLQSDFGAPDRSFYQGADSGSVVLALIDFGLAAGCAMGGILLMGGRVLGRVTCTVSG